MSETPAPEHPEHPAVAALRRVPWLDLAAVAVILWAGLTLWPMGDLPGIPPMDVAVPAWASLGDVVLSGPDAGEWASAATAFAQGRYEDLDPHRMPTWPLLVGTLMAWMPDVALAGHFLNHVCVVAAALAVYLLARPGAGRGLALGAAVAVACCPPLVEASRRLGSDSLLTALVLGLMLTAYLAARRWWLAPLAGVVAALCASTHYTALAFPVPALVLILIAGRGRWWERLAAPLLYLGAGALTLKGIFSIFPVPSPAGFSRALAEGISQGSQGVGADTRTDWSDALAIFSEADVLGAVNGAVSIALQWLVPSWLPWGLAVVLPWLGLVGLIRERRRPVRAVGRGLAVGIPLLLCLSPLPFLAAAGAPERYSQTLIPIAALLLARGLALPLGLVDMAVKAKVPRWPAGVLGLGVGLALAAGLWQGAARWVKPMPPRTEDVSAWQLGRAIAENFPAGGHVACPIREANVLAGRDYCPRTVCPTGTSESAFWFCLGIMNQECEGDGDLPYVSAVKSRGDERSENRKAMDAWVIEKWGAAAEVRTHDLDAWVVSVPRDELPVINGPR